MTSTDMCVVKKGVSFMPQLDGYFVSEFYMHEIVNAKVQEKKK
jgi:hypothetical protein